MNSVLASVIATIVSACARHKAIVALILIGAAAAATAYDVKHFRMNTETDALLSDALPFRQDQRKFEAAFRRAQPRMIAVIDGATPEIAERAAATLADAMAKREDLFSLVRRPDGGAFFRQNGLLYLSTDEVRDTTDELLRAQPFLGPVAEDTSLRGLMNALGFALDGVKKGNRSLADLDRLIAGLNDGLGPAAAGEKGYFSWRSVIAGKPPEPRDLRRIVQLEPKRDFSKLRAASKQAAAVRAAAQSLGLTAENGVTVRMTGSAVVADEELSSLAHNIGLIASLMVAAIVVMLWFATHSVRAIFAILVTTFAGLTFAAAFGLAVFGAFNVISVAFIPLFVGLGIDFGIQLAVRFRAEQRLDDGVGPALRRAAASMGRSLAVAATAISVGFLAFYPTDYIGLSQLGAIAGGGLVFAFLLSITLLPALLALAPPKGSLPETSFAPIAAIDAFVLGRRGVVLAIAGATALGGVALMPKVAFDFNPLHLRDQNAESIRTLYALAADDRTTPYFVSMLAPTLAEADAAAARLAALPEVARVVTVSRFVPKDQDEKLQLIEDANFGLTNALSPIETAPAPTDAETASSLAEAAGKLRAAADEAAGDAARAENARRLAATLDTLAQGAPALRAAASERVVRPLSEELDQIRDALSAERVSLDTLPEDLKADWLTEDGRARVSIYPKGDSSDNAVITRFATAVRKVAPDATGTPVNILESGNAVVRAFAVAGALSFAAISLLLFLTLRRLRDVAITMAPIVLTGLLTLGTSVLIGQPLNFANIIALPLLFGIGVAFHIYFVLAWRAGEGHLLQSSLARGVFFSALTTATGFGSLWLSSHPGTSSMGLLLMISLVWTLVSALLFQPALMGPHPEPGAPSKTTPSRRGRQGAS